MLFLEFLHVYFMLKYGLLNTIWSIEVVIELSSGLALDNTKHLFEIYYADTESECQCFDMSLWKGIVPSIF